MSAFKITGRMLTFSRITLESNDQAAIKKQLEQAAKHSPFAGAPIVIDSTVEQELIEIIQLLVSLDLQPMAVVDGILAEQAKDIQFPVIPKDRPVQRIKVNDDAVATTPSPEIAAVVSNTAADASNADKLEHKVGETQNTTPTETATIDKNTTPPPAEPQIKIVERPARTAYHPQILRTGQALIHEDGDVILHGGMNSGAEILASGNIHVYGHARGRLMAGIHGDIKARIFCQRLDAELISIAGVYCVADQIPSHAQSQAVFIYLNARQELVFEKFSP
ncbi:MAG: septum site-determining protein MinC [Acinetobacter sp.]|nr:septum site-determining protein MinC [Acinetobacter sp.]